MLRKLRNYIGEFRAYNRERRQVMRALGRKRDLLTARIVRFVHAIEKGLSIESPRPGFGYEKIKTMYGWVKEYLELGSVDKTCIYMAADALRAYLEYHAAIGVRSEKIREVELIATELQKIKDTDAIADTFGGTKILDKSDLAFDENDIEQFFNTRHSIRQFDNKPVSRELVERAIKLAQAAPSACNRQAVRAYAADTKRFLEIYPNNMQGVGGFFESCDKVIMITGKISAYEQNEYKQFIVSAGIFIGYLTMALHGLGLGSCVVQRSLRPEKDWIDFCAKCDIPSDEQIICLVVVGNLKDKTVVPYSNRFDLKTVFKWL